MSRLKIILLLVLLFSAGLLALQGLFSTRLKDPASLHLLQDLINEQRSAKEALVLRPGSWKTGWYLSARTDTLDILKGDVAEPLLTLKQLHFDLDIFPAFFKGRLHVRWEAREKSSASILKGVMEIGLLDFLPRSHQIQSGPLPIETLLLLVPERARSSPWLSGLQGRLRIDGRGSWEQGSFDLDISDLRWRGPGTRLPLLQGGRSRTQVVHTVDQWSFNPPLLIKDAQTGLEFKLDHEGTLRLTVSGPALGVAALAQSQRCPIGPRLELHWTSQGFVCR
jgi:hypothetical protein